MGYAETILRLRDADVETEVTFSALDGDSDDCAVLELDVVIPYASTSSAQKRGYVRLPRKSFDRLHAWLTAHMSHLVALEEEEYEPATAEPLDEDAEPSRG